MEIVCYFLDLTVDRQVIHLSDDWPRLPSPRSREIDAILPIRCEIVRSYQRRAVVTRYGQILAERDCRGVAAVPASPTIMNSFGPEELAEDRLRLMSTECREASQRGIPTPRPPRLLRAPEFWQQPRRRRVCLQSRMPRSRLQLPSSPGLWPLFRCEEEFPDNKQRPVERRDARLCSALVSITTREKPASSSSRRISAVS